MSYVKELNVNELRTECDLNLFDFETTEEINIEDKIIGQERALKAIDFGLNIKNNGTNIYISGVPGTGRSTTILKAIEKLAKNEPAPCDILYLYNFQNPDEPKGLKLPAGKGCELKNDIEKLINELESEIQKSFLSEEYEKHKKNILDKFEQKKDEYQKNLEDFAKTKGFDVQPTINELLVVPIHKHHPITTEEFESLPPDKKEEIISARDQVNEHLFQISRKVKVLQRDIKVEIQDLDKHVLMATIGPIIDEIKEKYKEHQEIHDHLDDIQVDILKNIYIFKKEQDNKLQFNQLFSKGPSREEILDNYRVNLIVDNCKAKGAPVIYEHHPTYYNLNGSIEYKARFGVLTTNFLMIKAGAVLKSDGGYLVIQAMELLRDYFAWDSLKKVLKFKEVKIEDIAQYYGFAPTSGLKPKPVSVELKVVLIGNPFLYHLLYIYDQDFEKLFKVKADFDVSVNKSESLVKDYAYFIASKCKEESLMPFHKAAVAEIINYSSRLVSHKKKLTARFLEIANLMRESDYWARRDKSETVQGFHVKKAIEEKVYRSNMIENKIRDMIKENTIIIDTEGYVVGQVNGISVIDLGDYSFGTPCRISARTFAGKGNIIDIEREAKLGGKIHSKGVFILSGFLGQKYAQDKPLAVSASICFEQQYQEVEGDSASSAELYCLLSSLGELPIKQEIAVTGSVSQMGKIQPVGGINEKIEGFFQVCKIKGLNGSQGVIIPSENVKHLMLKDELIEAVRNNQFHIYPVENIDQGIEILTGVPAGDLKPDKTFPKGSVHERINSKLLEYSKLLSEFAKK